MNITHIMYTEIGTVTNLTCRCTDRQKDTHTHCRCTDTHTHTHHTTPHHITANHLFKLFYIQDKIVLQIVPKMFFSVSGH